jgi:hypothetical protein
VRQKPENARLRRSSAMPRHRARLATPVAVCAFALLVSSVSAATTIGGAGLTLNASPSSSLGRTTSFYDRRGKFLCAVLRRPGWWAVKNSYGEQWIETNRGRLEAHFTHHLDGWGATLRSGSLERFCRCYRQRPLQVLRSHHSAHPESLELLQRQRTRPWLHARS